MTALSFAPTVWGEHLNAAERIMVDDLITHLRKPCEQSTAVEVRKLRDGRFVLFAIKRDDLTRERR